MTLHTRQINSYLGVLECIIDQDFNLIFQVNKIGPDSGQKCLSYGYYYECIVSDYENINIYQ